MPAYLQQFGACIIPFKVNAITEATDPVKFYEYISQGKAVVAPRMPELFPYADYLYIAEDHADFAWVKSVVRSVNRILVSPQGGCSWRRRIPGASG